MERYSMLQGYENAPLGGINPLAGSTVVHDFCGVRNGRIPLYLPEKCIHCGLCDTTCPDMVFRFEIGEWNKKMQMVNCGLDYHHCKGCMRCVEICPTHALIEAEEATAKLKFFVNNKDLVVDCVDYEPKGIDSRITPERRYKDGKVEVTAYET